MKNFAGEVQDTFKHAELKPKTPWGYAKFFEQLVAWRNVGLRGKVGLFMYDDIGNTEFIGSF
jgi:hypothetical protein